MIEIIATLTGVVGGVIGTFLAIRGHMLQVRSDYEKRLEDEMKRQSEARVKEYAAQRDFDHLKRHYEQLRESVQHLDSEIEQIRQSLLELQVMSKGAFNRIEQIAARVDATTGGNPRR